MAGAKGKPFHPLVSTINPVLLLKSMIRFSPLRVMVQRIEQFEGDALIQQEPDASSFPSGGIRATCARGYTV